MESFANVGDKLRFRNSVLMYLELKSHLFPSEIVDVVWIVKWLVVLRSIIAKLRIDFEDLVTGR